MFLWDAISRRVHFPGETFFSFYFFQVFCFVLTQQETLLFPTLTKYLDAIWPPFVKCEKYDVLLMISFSETAFKQSIQFRKNKFHYKELTLTLSHLARIGRKLTLSFDLMTILDFFFCYKEVKTIHFVCSQTPSSNCFTYFRETLNIKNLSNVKLVLNGKTHGF